MSSCARPASRADFRIAIFCALTLEAEAVESLFDPVYDEAVHNEYGKVPGDPNAYTLGKVGLYNAVLVHMPGAGKGIASSVAANVKASYPRIDLGLLVGICGGVPYVTDRDTSQGKKDIFLGDVIVSTAIVQYDLGKRLPGRFNRKDTLAENLGRPNQEIRAFLSMLGTSLRRRRLTGRLSNYLAIVQEKLDNPQTRYPGASKDRLFNPDYTHKLNDCLCVTMDTFSEAMVLRRRKCEREPPKQSVHFGVIGSGDTVMMSAKDRDRVANRDNIIGFEMEAAGI